MLTDVIDAAGHPRPPPRPASRSLLNPVLRQAPRRPFLLHVRQAEDIASALFLLHVRQAEHVASASQLESTCPSRLWMDILFSETCFEELELTAEHIFKF